jgi:REP element-mobilizing transposase RayT
LRYPGYDDAGPGAVFVTICTHGRQPLLGAVDRGQMVLTAAGDIVTACWQRIPCKYPAIGLDAMVVMPDHLHGILFIGVDPELAEARTTVGDAVRWFKAVTVRAYRDGVLTQDWEPYERHLWQDKFHDRIIRDPGELEIK